MIIFSLITIIFLIMQDIKFIIILYIIYDYFFICYKRFIKNDKNIQVKNNYLLI